MLVMDLARDLRVFAKLADNYNDGIRFQAGRVRRDEMSKRSGDVNQSVDLIRRTVDRLGSGGGGGN